MPHFKPTFPSQQSKLLNEYLVPNDGSFPYDFSLSPPSRYTSSQDLYSFAQGQ